MVELVQKLGKGRFVTKLDLNKEYGQISVAGDDISKTAFVNRNGCYEFLKMPFAMMNSSATLVRAMRKLFEGMEKVLIRGRHHTLHTDVAGPRNCPS